MFNSSILGVKTPKKRTILQCQSSPKSLKCPTRFAPSKVLKKSLLQIKRVHRFFFHQHHVCKSLEDIDLSHSKGKNFLEFLVDRDIPDSMIQMEELLLQENCLNATVRDYIAEEFDCDKELSFPLVCFFIYMNQTNVTLNEAIEELFSMPIENTVCEECIGLELNDDDKVKFSDYSNLKALHVRRNNVSDDSLGRSDDSVDDPDCILEKEVGETVSSNSESDTSVVEVSVDISNPFLSPQKEIQVSNPFLSPCKSDIYEFKDGSSPLSKKIEVSAAFKFDPQFNSTASSPKTFRKGISKICCDHCSKIFSNRYNMKLHLIRDFVFITTVCTLL